MPTNYSCHSSIQSSALEKSVALLNRINKPTLAIIALCTLILQFSSQAQINAEFSASVLQGCSPLVVNFTNQSTGSITSVRWKFGNSNTSILNDPSAAYIIPGPYDVTLIVYGNNGQVDSLVKQNYITVYDEPASNFTASDTVDCVPLSTQFTDLSQGTSPIQSWFWDFGDGNTSTVRNPAHTYRVKGEFTVSLRVTDTKGCDHFFSKNKYVKAEAPTPVMTANPMAACQPPLNVVFFNSSYGNGNISYQWNFGDNTTSTDKEPAHTYNASGSFGITLIATDQNGCSDTLNKPNLINIDIPIAAMSVNRYSGCSNPPTPFRFFNQSMGAYSFTRWLFGDGETSNSNNPTHSYDSPGMYTVTMMSGNGACNDTIIDTVYVQAPTAQFTMDRSAFCASPFPVQFTDQSINAISTRWTFDDHTPPSIQQHPLHTFYQEDTFTVTLTVTDSMGCIDTSMQDVLLDFPEVVVKPSIDSGCVPLGITFTADFTSIDPAATYHWDFGNSDSSSLDSLIYAYQDTGDFIITLTVTTQQGCIATDKDTIRAGDKSTITSFYVQGDSICTYGEEVFLHADFADYYAGFSTNNNNDTAFIGGGFITSDFAGWFTPVIVWGMHNGCPGNPRVSFDSLFLMGPGCTGIIPTTNCSNPYKFHFNHTGTRFQHAFWDFGDSTTSTDHYPTHLYAEQGVYHFTLILIDTVSGCNIGKRDSLIVIEPKAVITLSDTAGCGPIEVFVSEKFSENDSLFWWESNHPKINGANKKEDWYTFQQGSYYVRLIVQDSVNWCKDTMTRTIQSYQHDVDIRASITGGCAPLRVDFVSHPLADTTVRSYKWRIDNRLFYDSTSSYLFNTAGIYDISLLTEDHFGCEAMDVATIEVTDPRANFSTIKQVFCSNEEINFKNYSIPGSGLIYQWNFGDGNTSAAPYPLHQYQTTDTFTVSLNVIDQYGCTDTIAQNLVSIEAPVANFALDDSTSPCPPLPVNFTNQSSSNTTGWEWNFGDGSSSILANPLHNYTLPGNYDVALIVTNGVGCYDTLQALQLITVLGPVGDFEVTQSGICTPLQATFIFRDGQGVSAISWDMGDGHVLPGDTLNYAYTDAGIYYPSIILQSPGCTYAQANIDTIVVDTLRASFMVTPNSGCPPLTVRATDLSLGSVVEWDWNINGNSYSTDTLPQQTLNTPGIHTITLKIKNDNGCNASVTDTVTVFALPPITISGDMLTCANDSAQLNATFNSNYTYLWMPSDDLDNATSASPIATPDETTIYKVIVTSGDGCTDTSANHTVLVQEELEVFAYQDTTIALGDTALLNANANQPISTWLWTPSNTLTCNDCPNPQAFPTDSTIYTLTVTDTLGCSEKTAEVIVKVKDYGLNVAMPEAFSPNGDLVNDVIYVKGLNIKKLIYFRIYNRWGELIFETKNLNEGWDGTYKGVPQNIDTYAYVLKAVANYSDKESELRGNFSLIR